MFSYARRFRTLSPDERWLLAQLACAVPVIEIGLRVMGFKRMDRLLTWAVPQSPPEPRRLVRRTERLAHLAARRWPWTGRCLARALALRLVLRRRGVVTDLRIGVRWREHRFESHAWIEYQGQALVSTSDLPMTFIPMPLRQAADARA